MFSTTVSTAPRVLRPVTGSVTGFRWVRFSQVHLLAPSGAALENPRSWTAFPHQVSAVGARAWAAWGAVSATALPAVSTGASRTPLPAVSTGASTPRAWALAAALADLFWACRPSISPRRRRTPSSSGATSPAFAASITSRAPRQRFGFSRATRLASRCMRVLASETCSFKGRREVSRPPPLWADPSKPSSPSRAFPVGAGARAPSAPRRRATSLAASITLESSRGALPAWLECAFW